MKKTAVPKKQEKPMNPNKVLVENFVSLQKVMTNLSIKFDNLANQISKLLELFEISAKALAEKEFQLDKGDKNTKKMVEKIDNLLEQNKIIARGVALMHERENEIPQYPSQRFPPQEQSHQFQPPRKMINPKNDMRDYQKSISSEKDNHA